MIKRFPLPKGFTRSSQQQIDFPGGVTFSAFENFTQRMIRHGPQDQMNMVGHHNPIIQEIVLLVEMQQSFGDKLRVFRFP